MQSRSRWTDGKDESFCLKVIRYPAMLSQTDVATAAAVKLEGQNGLWNCSVSVFVKSVQALTSIDHHTLALSQLLTAAPFL